MAIKKENFIVGLNYFIYNKKTSAVHECKLLSLHNDYNLLNVELRFHQMMVTTVDIHVDENELHETIESALQQIEIIKISLDK